MKTIHNLIIIDASGSMGSKREEVTGGLNELFKQIKKDDKASKEIKNVITVIDFSSSGDFNVVYDKVTTSKLKLLKKGDYKTRGMTALFDAIGKSFLLIPEDAEAVFVNILTDGLENDSKEFKRSDIKSLITNQEENNWTVTFMGTTQESMLSAERIGIKKDRMLRYADSKAGTTVALDKLKRAKNVHTTAVMESSYPENLFADE